MQTPPDRPPTPADLDTAAERLAGHAHRTPILTSSSFDERVGARVYFKCENFQRVGAFKFRGAFSTVAGLTDDERARGVVTHSSGNHAQAVALAARLHGIAAHIVMPEGAAEVKVDAVRGYGARLVRCAPTHTAREESAAELVRETGGTLIHPFDDGRIIAGQSTAARELHEDAPEELDLLLGPVGGGGLMSGTCLVTRHLGRKTAVIGTEPEGADDAYRSFQAGSRQGVGVVDTVADGLRTPLSDLTFGILHQHLEDLVTVNDEAIVRAMRFIWQRLKILIEPSCAVPVAALLEAKVDARGKAVGVVLTGGNVDLDRLPW